MTTLRQAVSILSTLRVSFASSISPRYNGPVFLVPHVQKPAPNYHTFFIRYPAYLPNVKCKQERSNGTFIFFVSSGSMAPGLFALKRGCSIE